ncbi:MAG: bifunctional serine/threonine-protein kinase/formylglycine-generating enzyme family protein [Planctomycetota bacterium]
MSDDILRRALELFELSLQEPSDKREGFLRAAAGGDTALLEEALSLLTHAEGVPSSFVVPPAAPPSGTPTLCGQVLGDFTLERELGRGAMGVVYLARQRGFDRAVAVKILAIGLTTTSEQIERFHREARAAAKLDHAHIARVLADGARDDLHWFAMEFVPGRTLAEELDLQRRDAEPPPSPAPTLPLFGHVDHVTAVASVIADAASALSHAHERGVIHRDVKPSNLLLTPEACVKLVDFGVAHDEAFGSLTRSDQLVGSLPYMSPEQARVVQSPVDFRTDVYSLGVVLYELLTLRRPFQGATTHEIITKIRSVEAPPILALNPRVPRDLAVICEHAMSKRAVERYENAAALEADLRRFLRHEAILARPPTWRTRAARYLRKHRSSAIASAVACVAVLAGAFWSEHAARARALERRLAPLRELAQIQSWSDLPDARLVAARGTLSELSETGVPKRELDLCRGLERRMDALRSEWEQGARALTERGLRGASSGVDDGSGFKDAIRGVQLFHRMAVLFPESPCLLDPAVFQPRLTVSVINERGAAVTGRVGFRRLDPVTALAGPTEDVGALPLAAGSLALGHVRIVVEVDGYGLYEYSRVLGPGAEVALTITARDDQVEPTDMALITGARCAHAAIPDSPLRNVEYEVRSFWLDKYEVSIGDYRAFLDAHPTVAVPEHLAAIPRGSPEERLPIVQISWDEARAYAEWRGKRLPSHGEWMLAARGVGSGRPWPWLEGGLERANASGPPLEGTSFAERWPQFLARARDVRSFEAGQSPEGVFHLFGNVLEWTESHVSERSEGRLEPRYDRRIMCGTAWFGATMGGDLTSIEHWGTGPEYRRVTRGFRCARSATY